MADPAKYRTSEEVEEWKARDPIATLGAKLESLGMKSKRDSIDREIEQEINDAVQFAENAPFPNGAGAQDYAYYSHDY